MQTNYNKDKQTAIRYNRLINQGELLVVVKGTLLKILNQGITMLIMRASLTSTLFPLLHLPLKIHLNQDRDWKYITVGDKAYYFWPKEVVARNVYYIYTLSSWTLRTSLRTYVLRRVRKFFFFLSSQLF